MIPEIIFIKMDDTLFNFVVYFSLKKNSVNHWFFTPFMKPDYYRYGHRPRAPERTHRELKQLRTSPTTTTSKNNRFNDQNNSSDVHHAF